MSLVSSYHQRALSSMALRHSVRLRRGCAYSMGFGDGIARAAWRPAIAAVGEAPALFEDLPLNLRGSSLSPRSWSTLIDGVWRRLTLFRLYRGDQDEIDAKDYESDA
jgi:hypothetical protein